MLDVRYIYLYYNKDLLNNVLYCIVMSLSCPATGIEVVQWSGRATTTRHSRYLKCKQQTKLQQDHTQKMT